MPYTNRLIRWGLWKDLITYSLPLYSIFRNSLRPWWITVPSFLWKRSGMDTINSSRFWNQGESLRCGDETNALSCSYHYNSVKFCLVLWYISTSNILKDSCISVVSTDGCYGACAIRATWWTGSFGNLVSVTRARWSHHTSSCLGLMSESQMLSAVRGWVVNSRSCNAFFRVHLILCPLACR